MSPEEAAASRRNIAGFFRNGSSYEVERWVKTVKGERLFLFRNKFVHSGSGKNEVYLICSGTDITEERRAQERLRVLANTDLITGLPNRNAIEDKINHAIATRGEESFGTVYLDLDNFKKVNDAYGHMFGDRLLVEVALAILGCLSPDGARPPRRRRILGAGAANRSRAPANAGAAHHRQAENPFPYRPD